VVVAVVLVVSEVVLTLIRYELLVVFFSSTC
jgi:hypothetical protein